MVSRTRPSLSRVKPGDTGRSLGFGQPPQPVAGRDDLIALLVAHFGAVSGGGDYHCVDAEPLRRAWPFGPRLGL